MAYGRFRAWRREPVRFRGAFASYEAALRDVSSGMPAGYDHDAATDVSREFMQQIALWDYPIVYWLQHLQPTVLIDAAGRIARIWPKVKVPGHADEVLAAAKAL